MRAEVSCPRCDSRALIGHAVCPYCGFALIEDCTARSGRRPASRRAQRRSVRLHIPVLAAAALITAAGAGLVLFEAPAARSPSSDPLSAAEAERRLAARYPHLRHADDAVIACPEHDIRPGDQARCWVLARVGLQRSVTVRLSRRGNQVEIEDRNP